MTTTTTTTMTTRRDIRIASVASPRGRRDAARGTSAWSRQRADADAPMERNKMMTGPNGDGRVEHRTGDGRACVLASSASTSSIVMPSSSRRGVLVGTTLTASGVAYAGRPKRAEAFIDLPSRLHNRYFLVRHGESVLDVRGEILSNPSFKYDTTFGLTAKGRMQMQEAARRIVSSEFDGAPSWLYTSNFQRSFQSALVVREEVGLLFSQMRTEFSGLLDPRKMGSLDFGSMSAWDGVWANDLEDPLSTPPPVPSSLQPSASVESCFDLYRRALEAFTRLEATYFGEDLILVSHQDTLSVFAAALNGTDLGRHHIDYPFELGEVRCIDLTNPPKDSTISPIDLRGDYAPGDSAVNYI